TCREAGVEGAVTYSGRPNLLCGAPGPRVRGKLYSDQSYRFAPYAMSWLRPVRLKWRRAAADSAVAATWCGRNGGLLTLCPIHSASAVGRGPAVLGAAGWPSGLSRSATPSLGSYAQPRSSS